MFYAVKRCITLLEVLLVIAILAIISGFVGVNIAKAIQEQRFRSEVDLLVDQMRLAQELMLIFHGNVHLKITQLSDTECDYKLMFDSTLPNGWNEILQRKHKPLTSIRVINFQDHINLTEDPREMDLKFLSKGSVMSSGVMGLSTSENRWFSGALTRYIGLRGYPAPIVSSGSRPSDGDYRPRSDDVFDEQLTQRTIEEIRAEAELPSI